VAVKKIAEKKREVRERVGPARAKLSREEALKKSAEVQMLFFGLKEFHGAKTLLFYVAKGNEVQTERMIKDSLKLGKRVLVPITDKDSGELTLSELHDFDVELELGTFGILEPKPTCRRLTPPAHVDLVVVPGVAFDPEGHRLGHGKGCYDMFLRKVSSLKPAVQFIGLAYEFQILGKLPHGRSDVKVHKIVTENRVIAP
jgi:5-formyltetrahydrofolate cyclo-ligase